MYKSIIKPLCDFLAALLGLLLLSPVFIVISILVRLKHGAPVIYKQERPGIKGNAFLLYKFRSMTNAKDDQGNLLANNDRLTGFGKKLRATSLDELPSLLNVLKGEMSLVGPRPLRMRYLPYFTAEQFKRHHVKPGITGYAQVNGRSNLTWDEKFKLDVSYVNNVGFLLDLKILVKTFLGVILRRDTNPEGANFEIPFDDYMKEKRDA